MKIEELRERLVRYNEAYRRGEPVVGDEEYDGMVEELRRLSPNDEFFASGIVEKATDRMEPLPVPMYSLEKVKTGKKLLAWLESMKQAGCEYIVMTPKYDGISLLVDERNHSAWTRGDGTEGQNSREHFARMEAKYATENPEGFEYTWGEAIVSKKDFTTLQEKGAAYKNARNMVAGLFNSPEGYTNPCIGKVVFIRYGSSNPVDKTVCLRQLRDEFCGAATNYICIKIDVLLALDRGLEEYLDRIHREICTEFCIDGIVLEVDEYHVREQLGRLPNGNPRYAVAYKRPDWCDIYTTKVTGVTGGIGKSGTYNPIIEVEPVEMNGVTVSCCTGYNARYIIDNHVCPGAYINICRSGDVIPKHVETTEWPLYAFERQLTDVRVCPSCGGIMRWDESKINLVCHNPNCKQKVISCTTYFLRTVGCEGFDEPTIRRLYEEGYCTIDDVLQITKEACITLLGEKNGAKFYREIRRVCNHGVPFARLLTALNLFDGVLAEGTCQKILDYLGEDKVHRLYFGTFSDEEILEVEDEIKQISGVGRAIAEKFIDAVVRFHENMYEIPRTNIPATDFMPEFKKPPVLTTMNVCMTGFRDKAMEKQCFLKGYKVLNSVTKECNILIVASMSSTSSKMEKARKMGIRIVTRADFAKEIGM